MSVDWLPFPPRRPGGSRPPGWAPEAEAIIDQIRDEVENASAATDSSLASFVEDPASQTRAAIEAIAGGGGVALTPDPDNPGLYILASGSTALVPDPDNPGLYILSA